MLIQGGEVMYSKPSSFCGFAHYGVGLSLVCGHACVGLWGNTQEAGSTQISYLLVSQVSSVLWHVFGSVSLFLELIGTLML